MSQRNSKDRRNRDINDVLEVIGSESPRTTAIVLGAELDLALRDILESYFLPPNSVSQKYGSLFGPDEAAGSFSARIEVAYRAGLIPDWCQAELHVIRKVRNEFAHQATGFSFTDSPVRELIGQLRLPKRILEKHAHLWDETAAKDPKEMLIFSGSILMAELQCLFLNIRDGVHERVEQCRRDFTVPDANHAS